MVSFTDSSAMIIMNDLVRCFRDQLTFARKTNEPLRELTVREGIRIPEGLATLSNRQLNAVMANARFHCRFESGQTQNRLNARGGASKDVAGTMADPAGDRGYSQSYADAWFLSFRATLLTFVPETMATNYGCRDTSQDALRSRITW